MLHLKIITVFCSATIIFILSCKVYQKNLLCSQNSFVFYILFGVTIEFQNTFIYLKSTVYIPFTLLCIVSFGNKALESWFVLFSAMYFTNYKNEVFQSFFFLSEVCSFRKVYRTRIITRVFFYK